MTTVGLLRLSRKVSVPGPLPAPTERLSTLIVLVVPIRMMVAGPALGAPSLTWKLPVTDRVLALPTVIILTLAVAVRARKLVAVRLAALRSTLVVTVLGTAVPKVSCFTPVLSAV